MNALLIDIGNTRLKWRSIDTSRPDTGDREGSLDQAWRGADGALALGEIDRLAAHWRASVGDAVDAAFVSNVASDDIEAIVERALIGMWPAIRIERVHASPARGNVVNGYADPRKLGADRWLAMIGGHGLVPDRSLLVCTFGTATTIDLVVDEPGGAAVFVGGLILPGPDAMRAALVERTARLPHRPGRFVDFADSTDDAITSGVLSAQLGAVERGWRDARARVGTGDLVCLVAGGAAPAILASLSSCGIPATQVRAVPDLVLRGLALIAAESRNEPGRGTLR